MKPVSIGTPGSPHATRVLLLGSGELGKEVVIELQAVRRRGDRLRSLRERPADAGRASQPRDRHARSRGAARVVEQEQPHLIVPEIEAIATAELLELEREGWTVIPTAQAARLTMDREAIRRVAAEELGLPTARYQFADTFEELRSAAKGARLAGRDQADHELVGEGPVAREDRGRVSRRAGTTRRPAGARAPAA